MNRPTIVLGLLMGVSLIIAPASQAVGADAPAARLAILDLRTPPDLSDEVSRLLSDVVRAAGRDVLPSEDYVVMTRENLLELLPPGTSLVDCVGDCSVEIGRKIQADYVVTGEVMQVGSQLRGTLSLFDCRTANLLGQAGVRGETLDQFETDLLNETTSLLLVLPNAARDQRGLRREAAVAYRDGRAARSRTNRWIVVGALAAGGYAVYANTTSEAAWDDYQGATNPEEAAESWDDYSSSAQQRDIAIGVAAVFVGWRLWRAFQGERTEDEYSRDLLLKSRLSIEATPTGPEYRVTLLVRGFGGAE